MNNFSEKIISWYEINGRKNLPWQKKDPYKVWISEIMLQQTQVTTVIPYFNKFISEYPTIKTLASTSLDEVLSLWSGLGYYTRARNIHKTAKILKKDFDCKLPNEIEALMSLPGIGFSTAGAILSLGFEQSGVILDGNVKRVLLRISGNKSPMNKYKTEKSLKEFANILLPDSKHKEYSQGLMDLGAIICRPNKQKIKFFLKEIKKKEFGKIFGFFQKKIFFLQRKFLKYFLWKRIFQVLSIIYPIKSF